jgi:hypothetical protein
MKSWFQFSLNKIDPKNMKFLYLRIGSTKKIFDELQETSQVKEIIWELNEAESFRDYHFSSNITDYDGIIINMDISDDDIQDFRRDFWEHYIWQTEDKTLVTALVIPNSNSAGSLTRSQVIEALSLIRLTDRPFELFEIEDDFADKLLDWLIKTSIFAHRKSRIEQETNDG